MVQKTTILLLTLLFNALVAVAAPRPAYQEDLTATLDYALGLSEDQLQILAQPVRFSHSKAIAAEAPFCKDLYLAICGSNGSVAADRAERIKKAMLSVEAEATPELLEQARIYDLSVSDPSDLFHSLLQGVIIRYPYSLVKAKTAAAALFAAIEGRLLKKMKLPDFARTRELTLLNIESTRDLSPAIKVEMKKRILDTQFLLPSEYLNQLATSSDDVWPLLSRGAVDGAWNQNADIEGRPFSRVIVLPPGLLAAETDSANSQDSESSPSLSFVLAHELAHSIDFDSFPEAYRSIDAFLPSFQRAQATELPEISADYWGVELIARQLSMLHATQVQTLDFLRHSHEILCDAQSEDTAMAWLESKFVHPSGEFRIREILGRHPTILSHLGCAMPQKNQVQGQ